MTTPEMPEGVHARYTYRRRLTDAIRNAPGMGLTVTSVVDAVMAVRDEEIAALRAEMERLKRDYNAANAMMGVHKRRADRLKTELEHAKGALAGDSEAVAGFMADHAEVLARAREQRDMWQRAAEQAEAAIDRAHALAESWAREPHPTHDHPCPDDVHSPETKIERGGPGANMGSRNQDPPEWPAG